MDISKPLYNRLSERISEIPIINTHSHHLPDELLQSVGLKDILSNSYVNWMSPPPDFEDSAECEAYINKNYSNTYFRWLFKAFEDLYGIRLTKDNFKELDKAVKNAYSDKGHHLRVLTENCRFDKIVNERQPDPGSNLGHPELFFPSFRCDSFFSAHLKDKPDPNNFFAYSLFSKQEINDIADYLNEVGNAIANKKSEGCVALKVAIAYERPLSFKKADLLKAQRALNNPNADEEAITAFGDAVMHTIVSTAAELDIPVQIHTGMGQLRDTRPIMLLDLIEAHPDTKFHLLHGGFPWFDDTYALLHNYKNVWSDTCWIPYLSTTAAVDYYIKALEASDTHRMTWGCDTWMSEDAYGALLAMEHALSMALAIMIEDGAFDEDYALYIAERILRQNALELFFGKAE